jgi:hypothetical protein
LFIGFMNRMDRVKLLFRHTSLFLLESHLVTTRRQLSHSSSADRGERIVAGSLQGGFDWHAARREPFQGLSCCQTHLKARKAA